MTTRIEEHHDAWRKSFWGESTFADHLIESGHNPEDLFSRIVQSTFMLLRRWFLTRNTCISFYCCLLELYGTRKYDVTKFSTAEYAYEKCNFFPVVYDISLPLLKVTRYSRLVKECDGRNFSTYYIFIERNRSFLPVVWRKDYRMRYFPKTF